MATHSSVLAWRIPGSGAWWASIYGVAQSWTRLKPLSNSNSRGDHSCLPRSKRILISWLQSPSAVIWEPKKIQSVTVSPSICHEVMGPDAMILVFWTLSFKSAFSLSSFTFIKRLFSSSSLSAVRVMSSAYQRLLIFLLAVLIPACASSNLVFCMMYSACKLNKHGDNIQPWRILFGRCVNVLVACCCVRNCPQI